MPTVMDKVLLGVRHKEAWRPTSEQPVDPERGFELLEGHKYALLTTFRRNGEGVPTPVWFGLSEDGKLYFNSESEVGKMKRIRANQEVLISPCTSRGKPLGPPARGRARVLGDGDRAERAIAANYGAGRRLFEAAAHQTSVETVYVEVEPAVSG